VFSIQVAWLPSGTGVFGRMSSGRTRRSALPPRCVWTLPTRIFRRMSSGADTEVRPPAILGWGPEGGFLWLVAQRGYDTSRYPVSACDALLARYGPRSSVHRPRHPSPVTRHPLFTSPLKI